MPFKPDTLRRLREDRGLSQQQLADAAGTHRVTIAKLETGARGPSVEMLEALAKALKVKVGALLGE